MAHNSMMTMNSNNSDVVVLLCAPSHDRLTHYTSSLLEDFPSLGTRTILCTFDSPLKYDQLLANYSINPKETDVAVIFCGHGKEPSLQGPGENPGSPDYSTAQSVFYEDSFLHMGPKIMLAACCYSALGLGRSFERKTTGATFVGFDDEIGFVTRGGVYADSWREIIHRSAFAMLHAVDVNDLEASIRHAYKEVLSFFDRRSGKKYRYGLMMRNYLRKQIETINFVQT